MRSFSGLFALLVAIALVVLAFMNPQMEDFEAFAADHLEAQLQERVQERAGGLGGLLARAGASLVRQYLDRVVSRENYVVASVYTVDLDGSNADQLEWKFLGIAGRFIPLETPSEETRRRVSPQ